MMSLVIAFVTPPMPGSMVSGRQFDGPATKRLFRTLTKYANTRRIQPSCCTLMSNVTRLREEIETKAGATRGIFGMEDEYRQELERIIQAVEAESPVPKPTADNAAVAAGTWRLCYTTLQILGRRRVKLAIATPRKPGLVNLGDFLQVVDAEQMETSNIIHFDVMGKTNGTFSVQAKYHVVSDNRVSVDTTGSSLQPEALNKLLGQNQSLLLDIFNPQGYLDITYVDDELRIGRDDKGQVFVLEKIETSLETNENI